MKRLALFLLMLTPLGCSQRGNLYSTSQPFDVIIYNGTVFADGFGEGENLDVGIMNDQIVALGNLKSSKAHTLIDAQGKLVVPGFIDVHTHADEGGALSEYLQQGVTTIVAGNCGRSPSPSGMSEYFESLDGNLGPNYIALVGHNTLRNEVDLTGSTATDEQMRIMKESLAQGMESGAFGMSTGLIYNPGFNSTTEEISELATVSAKYDGLYATHMRSEGEGVLDSVREAIEVGQQSGSRVQISHVKCAGPAAWGLTDEFMTLVDDAANGGLEIWVDQYPYAASQTTINAVIPDWAENDWEDSIANRRDELESGIRELIAGRGGAERIYISRGEFSKRYLSDLASEFDLPPEVVVIDRIGLGNASAIYHMMQEEDVQAFMVHPRLMTSSDGPSRTHPRGHGTFPRLWGEYGREVGILGPQDCVLKTSTLPATQFRLFDQNRGRIAKNYYADIVILDPETISDGATFENPTLPPTGISEVFVNGTLVVKNGDYLDETPGRVLKRK